jgi:riboflavin synthase
MFTGLVSHCVELRSVAFRDRGAVLVCPNPWHEDGADLVQAGESIAVSGCCLSAVAPIGRDLSFELSAETLARSWFASLAPGRRLNLERSVRLSDRLGGHLVSGHVDGTGELIELHNSQDGGRRLRFSAPQQVERYLIEKGSVTIDGVSLTVIEPRGGLFDVALIPSTLAATSLGSAAVGDRVHLEADQIGKWIEQLIRARRTARRRKS